MLTLPKDTLVVVADGAGAVLFRTETAPLGKVALRQTERLGPENLLDDGPSGSRPEEQTQQQTDEATFAKQLTQKLNKMIVAGEFDKLILVADPQTLGQVRGVMRKDVEQAVVLSLSKDLTNHTTDAIARVIEAAL